MKGQEIIDAIRKGFESGQKPRKIAENLNISTHKVSAVGRIFGFEIKSGIPIDPYQWRNLVGNSKHFGFSTKMVKLENKMSKYRLLSIDEKRKQLLIEYQ